MKKLIVLAGFVLMFGMNFGAYAAEDQANADAATKQQIEAVCKSEASGASYPQDYFDECVEEKLQAAKEQQASPDLKDPA